MTAELMAGWRYALPGHFFVPRAFFAVKLRRIVELQETPLRPFWWLLAGIAECASIR